MSQQTMTPAGPPVQRKGETLLKAADIARRLGVSRSTAYKLMTESIPVIRFGPGTLRVRESDLEAFIASRVDHHQES